MITDLEMMQTPLLWPCWPLLPVKKYGNGDTVHGVMLALAPCRFNVYLVSMFSLGGRSISIADADALPQLKFESHEDIIRAGWRVD